MSNFPVILIEVILVFGGVLAFGIWQLRALKKQETPPDAEKSKTSEDEPQ
jgi:hypothetical protein